MRADCSVITARSWCWTATADSAPNSRSSSFASWPFSGAKTSSTRLPRNSATVRAFSVNAPSTSRETFSNSVRTKSALTSACSRERTRAPISIASTSSSAGSAPASVRSRTSVDGAAVAHGERVGDDDVADDRDAGGAEWRCGFHDGRVARYGRHLTERAIASLSRREPCSPSGGSPATSSRATSASPGPPRHSSTSRSTASGAPSNTASTVPSDRFAAQPATPSRSAARRRNRGRRRPARGRGRGPACAPLLPATLGLGFRHSS